MTRRRLLAPPRDLTIPEPGSSTARDLLSRTIAKLLEEIRPLVQAHATLAPAADVASFDPLLRSMLTTRVGPLASILRRPNVGALVRTLRRSPEKGDAELLRELIGLVSFELSVMHELPFEVVLSSFPPRIVSTSARIALDLPVDVSRVALTSGHMQVSHGGEKDDVDLDALGEGGTFSVRRPFTPIDGDTVLALEDNNPLALVEAHPDKLGNAIDVGGASTATWIGSLQAAFQLVATYLPDVRAEMDLYLSQIVPVGVDADRHLSASYREAIGTVYMTLHPNPMTMVEALIHEFQHNKLNALFELDDVLENAFFPFYPSPVRPDPRPLHGVLLAVHAFLPVEELYERMIADHHPLAHHESFRARLLSIKDINREGASVVLEHGVPTAIGAGLLDEIRRLSAIATPC